MNTWRDLSAAVIVAFAITGAGILVQKVAHKLNAKANADIRAAAAQERIADALERAYPIPAPAPQVQETSEEIVRKHFDSMSDLEKIASQVCSDHSIPSEEKEATCGRATP